MSKKFDKRGDDGRSWVHQKTSHFRRPSHMNEDVEPLLVNDTFTEQYYSSVNDDDYNDDDEASIRGKSLLVIQNSNSQSRAHSGSKLPRSLRDVVLKQQTNRTTFNHTRPSYPKQDQYSSPRSIPVRQDKVTSEQLVHNANPIAEKSNWLSSHGVGCCQCVRTQELGFVERLGSFRSIVGPGLQCLCWPIDTVAGRLTLRIQQLDVTCETITKDRTFVTVEVSLLYKVASGMTYEAYYKLTDVRGQIQSIILDAVRYEVPSRTLDEVFMDSGSLSSLSNAISRNLENVLIEYGYEITSTLIRRIEPNRSTKDAMNEINASKRMKAAAAHSAEANKIQLIRKAEAHAEHSYLMGIGIANERKAIARGMNETVITWSEMDVRTVNPPKPKEVMDLLLLTQYMDLLAGLQPDAIFVRYGIQEVDCTLKHLTKRINESSENPVSDITNKQLDVFGLFSTS